MYYFQSLKLPLVCTLAALWLGGFYIDAQNFNAVVNKEKFGNLSGSADVVWTYTTPDLSKTAIYCITESRVNIVYKRAGGTALAQGVFTGRVDPIDITTTSPFSIGFKLKNIAFTDAGRYSCGMIYDGGAPLPSDEYNFKIYERPRFINCLSDGLTNQYNTIAFWLREGGVLNSTCYAYGNPVPTLYCRTYDNANNQQAELTRVRLNYTSIPLTDRMLFYDVRRTVTKVRCVADGGPTGTVSIEQNVRVDYVPSAPRDIKLLKSTPDSIRISWSPPQELGMSPITDYYMELFHPNGTSTATNYTVLSVNPILDYTFGKLFANLEYRIRISAYNAVGRGLQSPEAKFKTVFYDITSAPRTSDGLSTGSIVGIVFGVLCAIVLILIIVFFVLKKRKEKARYPQTYVEEAVDYPAAGDGMYAHVNKQKPYSSGNESTSGYPDIIHQAKPGEDEKPMMQSDSQPREDGQTNAYEKSRKEYV